MSAPGFREGELPEEFNWQELDLPNPGDPPKPDPWWRRQTPATIVSKAEDRVRWAWSNYARYLKIATQANVRTGSLRTMEEGLTAQHSRCLEGIQKAMEEKAPMNRKVSRDTAKLVAGKAIRFQRQSKRFTDSVLNEVHAKAGGFPRYPSPDAPGMNPSPMVRQVASAKASNGEYLTPNDFQNEGQVGPQATKKKGPPRQVRYGMRRPPSFDGIGENYQMDDQAGRSSHPIVA